MCFKFSWVKYFLLYLRTFYTWKIRIRKFWTLFYSYVHTFGSIYFFIEDVRYICIEKTIFFCFLKLPIFLLIDEIWNINPSALIKAICFTKNITLWIKRSRTAYHVFLLIASITFIFCIVLVSKGKPSFTHFKPPVSFYTPWKRKTFGFMMFLGGIERD